MKKFFVLAVLAAVFIGCGDIITDDAYNEAYMEDDFIAHEKRKKDNYYYGTFVLYFADKLMPQKIAVRVVDDEVFTIQEVPDSPMKYTWAIDKVLKDNEGYWDENYLDYMTFGFECKASMMPSANLSFVRENQSEDYLKSINNDFATALQIALDKYKTDKQLIENQYQAGQITGGEYQNRMNEIEAALAAEYSSAETDYEKRLEAWQNSPAIWLFSLTYQNEDLDVVSLEFEDKNNPETKFTKADYLNEKNNRAKRYITKIRTNTGETIESSFYK